MSTEPTDMLQLQISSNKQQQEATYIGQRQQIIGFAAGSKSYSDGSTITHSIHIACTNQAEAWAQANAQTWLTAGPCSCLELN